MNHLEITKQKLFFEKVLENCVMCYITIILLKTKCYFHESDNPQAFKYGFNGFLVSKHIRLDR